MKYLLDTNACVDYLTGRYPRLTRRIQGSSPEDLCVSSVAVAELRYGAEKSAHKQRNHERLDAFLGEIRCLDFSSEAASAYGHIRAALERQGRIIGPYDLQIAAHALSLGLVLVSDNVREFRRVKGLKIENWRGPR
jgi:tRNA(fMet)-specific endonuclease VapC